MVEPGQRCLDDRYELHELIASGGMGQVWRGRDLLFGRPVAVKVLRSEYTGDPTFLARFRAEAQHAAALSHPHIACVLDYGETVALDGSGETLAYLVMELVEGEPLTAVLRRDGALDTATTLALLRQAGEALGEAHRVGMVHRDVKPGNILVRADGSVKITDFGIAWSAGSVPLTRTGQVIGTPQYLSPEVAEGRQATPASDVYALGLVGYECLTGHSAFDGDNAVTIALKQVREQPEPLPAELPPGIRALVDRALAKDPHRRLADGRAFVAALDDVAAGRELPPPAAPAGDPAPATVVATGGSPRGGAGSGARRSTAADRRPAAGSTGPVRPVRGAPARGGYRHRVLTVLVPLLALLTGAAIAAVVLNGLVGGQRSGAVAPAVAADTGTRTFTLVGANFVGRPVNEVAIQLAALGLTVERVQSVTSAVAPSTVVAIDPAGSPLRAGDTVTVSYAVRPPTYDTRARSSVNQETVRRGSTAAAPARTTAPEATRRATPTADAPAASSTDDGAASSSSSTDPGSSAPGSSGSGSDSSSAAPATSSSAPSTTSSTPSRSSTSSSGHGYHDDGDDEDG